MVDDRFWELAHLSDERLLASLRGALRTKRRALAEVVAHLAEVEERRLHLQAAFGSLFAYCVQRLDMSEDEACRRIELSRLARRFPMLFAELASGRISLSVALLLKPVLSADNHGELIAAARGTSLQSARELLAARFPRPDVPSHIRKLPERKQARLAGSPPPAGIHAAIDVSRPAERSVAITAECSPGIPLEPSSALTSTQPHEPSPSFPPRPDDSAAVASSQVSHPAVHSRPQKRQLLEPLSPGRYRIQLTADATFKHKLEHARDLLRHAHPEGNFADILSRALDLLIEEVLKTRFGRRRAARPMLPSEQAGPERAQSPRSAQEKLPSEHSLPEATQRPRSAQEKLPSEHSLPEATRSPPSAQEKLPSEQARPERARSPRSATPNTSRESSLAAAAAATRASAGTTATTVTPSPRPSTSRAGANQSRPVARASRRAVLERDGLGCSWVDADGQRCGSTAWLELDHRAPAGKGGGSDPSNLRLLCRAHNRHAAERAYGREHVERAIAARRRRSRTTRAGAARADPR